MTAAEFPLPPPDDQPDLLARPGRAPRWTERLARWLLRRAGWRVTGVYPSAPRVVVVVAPHTSNWDFPLGVLAGWGTGLLGDYPHGFLMKHTLDRWPFRPIMRRLGGIPVIRSRPEHAVERAVAAIEAAPRFLLAIAPEGTRRPAPHWRSGFRHIARQAGAPVVPVALDYGRKEVRFGAAQALTGDAERDMERLRGFYEGTRGHTDEFAAPVELRRGDEPGG